MHSSRVALFGTQVIRKMFQSAPRRNLNYLQRGLCLNITSKRLENIPRAPLAGLPLPSLQQINRRCLHFDSVKLGRFTEDDSSDDDYQFDRGHFTDSEDDGNLPSVARDIPSYVPRVPIIATNFIIFPKFMKLMEITDPDLIKEIRLSLSKNQPYAAFFLRKELQPDKHTIKDLNEVHSVGVFAKLEEVNYISSDKLRLVAIGCRRIQLESASGKQDGKIWDKVMANRMPFFSSGRKMAPEECDALFHLMQKEVEAIKAAPKSPAKANAKPAAIEKEKAKKESKNSAQPKPAPDVLEGKEEEITDSEYNDAKILYVITRNVRDEAIDIEAAEYKALSMEIVATIRDIIGMNPLIRDSLQQVIGQNLRIADNPAFLADLSVALTSAKQTELQEVLEEVDVSAFSPLECLDFTAFSFSRD